jgi:hypothetical protein
MDSTTNLLAEHLQDASSSWSVGEFGVLAEFHHAGRDIRNFDPHTVAAKGGALRARPHAGVRILAYETPSPNPRLWNHGVAFCLPEGEARMECRAGITELGPDRDAILEEARHEILFDLGLARRSVNFCVRTADPALIDLLRGAKGTSVLARPDLNAAIVAAGPARVVESRLARIEVTNPIPPPGGVSPDGPHTHLMPGLIKRGRAHDANIPVPPGFLPCLTLYPAHPARDAEGREKPFDAERHAQYQRLRERYGDPDYVAAKKDAGPPRSRKENLGRLIAARQRAMVHSSVRK